MKRKFVYIIFLVMVTLSLAGCEKTEIMKETDSETVSEDFVELSVVEKETEPEDSEPSAEEALLEQEDVNQQSSDNNTVVVPVDAESWEIIQEYGFAENAWGYGPDETYPTLSYEVDLDTIQDYGSWYTVEALFEKPIYVSEEEYRSGHFTVTTNELTGETETIDIEFDEDGFCYEYYLVDGMLYQDSYDRCDCTFYRGILCINKDAELGEPIINQYWSVESGNWLEWVNGISFDENGCVTSMMSFGD